MTAKRPTLHLPRRAEPIDAERTFWQLATAAGSASGTPAKTYEQLLLQWRATFPDADDQARDKARARLALLCGVA